MTEGEITAANDAVLTAIDILTQFFGGNIVVIFYIAGIMGICGVLIFPFKYLYKALDARE